ILSIANAPERIVKQTWNSNTTSSGKDRYNYVTPDYTIGSTSAYYGPQDKQIVADLASTKDLSSIAMVNDEFDAPYGQVQTADSTGHLKPTHLKNALAAVQDKSWMTVLSNLAPEFIANPSKTYTNVSTSIIFPSNVDHLYLDGNPIAATPNSTINAAV